MEEYIFLDTDYYGNAEYDIRDTEYKLLIHLCCKYAKVFSMVVTTPFSAIIEKLQPYQVAKPNNISLSFPEYDYQSASINYYQICPEICEILANAVGGIFEWIDGWDFTNPNDPTFYREDGSVFFTSIIHDGVCVLMPRPEENVTEIIKNSLWIKRDENNLSMFPALPYD